MEEKMCIKFKVVNEKGDTGRGVCVCVCVCVYDIKEGELMGVDMIS